MDALYRIPADKYWLVDIDGALYVVDALYDSRKPIYGPTTDRGLLHLLADAVIKAKDMGFRTDPEYVNMLVDNIVAERSEAF